MKNQQAVNRKNYKYEPVSSHDLDDDDIVLPRSGMMRNSRAKRIGNEISTYVHSSFWIGLAIFVIKYSDLIRVIRLDDRVILPLLYISGASWCGVIAFVFYLSFFLPCCKKEKVEDFNVTHPQHIHATLFLTVVAYVTFIIAIWPIWSWMSILIVSCILMGLLMVPNFIPNY